MYAYYIVPGEEFDAAEFGAADYTDFDNEVHVIQEIGLHRLAYQNHLHRTTGDRSHLRAVFFDAADAGEYQRMITE